MFFSRQVVTISLRCVSGLVKFPLPSLTRCVPKIGKNLFKLLKNYAKAGAKVGENFEMVLSAFKVNDLLSCSGCLGIRSLLWCPSLVSHVNWFFNSTESNMV